ncbi:hypothetical protein DAEQUDRAFT_251155 [Daedalea quercina L-15889]|uniref:Uncharacterized protein n=1 Tax=Daedalea quercina L-15889 TaxID=1314783 RepID=A0A165QNQ3_9APHY|nr:hypothetical protein DAEQUDRAFT_251155 [Daedalea quercina L-15889]
MSASTNPSSTRTSAFRRSWDPARTTDSFPSPCCFSSQLKTPLLLHTARTTACCLGLLAVSLFSKHLNAFRPSISPFAGSRSVACGSRKTKSQLMANRLPSPASPPAGPPSRSNRSTCAGGITR